MTRDPLTPDTPTILTPEEVSNEVGIALLRGGTSAAYHAAKRLGDSHEAIRSRLQQVEQERNQLLRDLRLTIAGGEATSRELYAEHTRAKEAEAALTAAQRRAEELEGSLAGAGGTIFALGISQRSADEREAFAKKEFEAITEILKAKATR